MTLVTPEGTPTLGMTAVKAVLTVADPEAPKLATELNAATSVDISCYLFPEGWGPTGTTAKGTKRRRLCSKSTVEQFNTTSYTLPALQYTYDPQGELADPGNEAYELLVEGTKLHLVERIGLDAEDEAWAVGQKTVDHYVELGAQIKSGDRTDENGEFFITQEVIYVLPSGPVDGTIAT